jgi:uncharacterized integral membrane protein (TIGR00698 family)
MTQDKPHETAATTPASRVSRARRQVFRLVPGVALAGVIALAATFVARLHDGPQLLYALMFGVAFNYLSHEGRTRPGIEFSGRMVLRLGVGLLGARITASQIAGLGWETALTVVAATVTTVLCGLAAGRWLQMSRAQGVLSGGAVAICGASAALAISAVLPREKGGERFTLMVVVAVTILSTLAMIVYPFIARLLELPPPLAGLFLGGTIHDVAQVVGAGYTLGQDTGDSATIVKLFRVSLLTVVVLIVSVAFKGERERVLQDHAGDGEPARPPLMPWFLWVFIGMVVLNSMGALSPQVQSATSGFSRACLVVAIAALGMKTSVQELARLGWRPLALIVIETAWIAVFVLSVIVWGR